MDGGGGPWDGTHLPDPLPEAVILGQHVKQIISPEYDPLYPIPLQVLHLLLPQPVRMAIPVIINTKSSILLKQKLHCHPASASIASDCHPCRYLVRGVTTWAVRRDPSHHRSSSTVSLLGTSSASDMMTTSPGVDGYPLLGLEDERVFADAASECTVDDLGGLELEAREVVREEERLGDAGEGGVGLDQHKLVDEGEEVTSADLEQVELVVEEDGVADSAWLRAEAPAVVAA